MSSNAGRKTKRTPATVKRIERALGRGLSNKQACAYAGIHPAQFYRWLEQAEAEERALEEEGLDPSEVTPEEGSAREFRDLITRARAKRLARLSRIIDEAAPQDWRAAAWKLERMAPEEFGPPKTRAEVTLGGETKLRVVTDMTELPEEVLERFTEKPDGGGDAG